MEHSIIIVILIFLGYFVIHSITASIGLKQWVSVRWPTSMPWYRLGFNALAVVLCVPLLWILSVYPGEPLWQWQGWLFYLANGFAFLAMVGFIASLKYYDLHEFFGTRQLMGKVTSVKDLEAFHISPFHRYVRHPWYFFLLVLIWTRDMSTTQFAAYLMVTLYLIVGSRMEEKKLIVYHGEVYRLYCEKVSGLVPLPWKKLNPRQAEALLLKYKQNDT